MEFVIGRDGGDGPVAGLGTYRALDGSEGADVALDVDRPHVLTVVGKRGYGKSHTLGVLAEELAVTPGLAPVAGTASWAASGANAPIGSMTTGASPGVTASSSARTPSVCDLP